MTRVGSFGSTTTSNCRQPGSPRAAAAFSASFSMNASTFSGRIRMSTCRTKLIAFPLDLETRSLACRADRLRHARHQLVRRFREELDELVARDQALEEPRRLVMPGARRPRHARDLLQL